MASFTAARSIFRSSAARNAAARLASQSKSKPKAPPFSLNSTANKPVLRRSPVEMSFAVESMMPYHTVTASALMTSMLSISRCGYGWLPEGANSSLFML
ncbi:protein NUCLEAR FUSION DEFECTIVE 6, mitochondrial isoform X1 [Populus trichocarpa]|nr:protein NUCLEAR FUSION DEFECTIVE 6, mitochondrial isoform X1 [Populus trichocarpa]